MIKKDDPKWNFPKVDYNLEQRIAYVDHMVQYDLEPEQHLIAVLLDAGVLFTNALHWKDDWPADARKYTALVVNCNDVFAWGCADGEDINYYELTDLWKDWRKDPCWGPAIWCMKKRQEMPQKPLEDIIRKEGIWNFEELGLSDNTMDAAVTELMTGKKH